MERMDDFDLSQALDGPPEFEPCPCNMLQVQVQVQVQDETFSLAEGLDLVVSHNPKTMQSVAHLLMAVNRMKKSLTRDGRKLRDEELCSVIMDSLVDEKVVQTTANVATETVRALFYRADSVKLCTLCDTSQKDIVQKSGDVKLQAVTLKGGHGDRKVRFKLSRYVTPTVSEGGGQVVVLSITNSSWHISCTEKDGKATLDLEAISENVLETISDNHDRFLFIKRTTGLSLTTFESVRCPGWFISTSYADEDELVEMCVADAAGRVTCFKLN